MIFAFTTAYASYEDDEKFYVEAGSVYVAPNGIFLNIDGELLGITSIEVDENGVYVPAPIAGFCGRHSRYPGSATSCPYCLAEKRKKKK